MPRMCGPIGPYNCFGAGFYKTDQRHPQKPNWQPMYPMDWFYLAVDSHTRDKCEDIRRLMAAGEKDNAKKTKEELYAVSYIASGFVNGQRAKQNALNAAMVMEDLDKLLPKYNPLDIYNEFIRGKEKENEIYLVHITPSGTGLRIVAEQHVGETIPQAQERLLRQLNLGFLIDEGHKDEVITDSARISYVPYMSYILYINPDGLMFANQAEADRVAEQFAYNNQKQTQPVAQPANTTGNTTTVASTYKKFGEYPNEYNGVPFSQIIDELTRKMGRFPVKEGVREDTCFRLACHLRYICEDNSTWIQQVLPDYGLPKDEWLGAIKSAFREDYNLNEHMPKILYRTLRDLGVAPVFDSANNQLALNDEDIIEVEAEEIPVPDDNGNTVKVAPVTYDSDPNALPLPPLTRELQLLTARYMGKQQKLVVPTIVGALPIFYTYLTGIRYIYPYEHAEYALNSQTYIIAKSRGGKGIVFRGLDPIIEPLREMDAAAKKAWAKYEKDMERYEAACDRKKSGDNKPEKPEEPQIVERLLGVSAGVSKACMKMEKAHGQHLLQYTDEIGQFADALKKDFGAGRHFYKKAFDNGEYSQDYISKDTWSGYIRVFLNFVVLGTPEYVPQLFRTNISDGFTQRATIATIDDDGIKKGAEIDAYDSEVKAELQAICRKFMQESGLRYCPWIDDAARKFLDEKEALCYHTGNDAIYDLAITIAVMGACAGYYYSISNGCALTQPGEPTGSQDEQNATAFAQWLMEYEWRQHMRLWGDLLENPVQLPKPGMIYQILDMMPEQFTTQQLDNLCKNLPKYKNNASVLTQRWVKAKVVEKVGRASYRKVVKNAPFANNTLTIAAPETASDASLIPVETQETNIGA